MVRWLDEKVPKTFWYIVRTAVIKSKGTHQIQFWNSCSFFNWVYHSDWNADKVLHTWSGAFETIQSIQTCNIKYNYCLPWCLLKHSKIHHGWTAEEHDKRLIYWNCYDWMITCGGHNTVEERADYYLHWDKDSDRNASSLLWINFIMIWIMIYYDYE